MHVQVHNKNMVCRDQVIVFRYNMRFRLRNASSGSSSSARSWVSAGLSSECTLDAMLERRVGGPGVSMPLKGYRAPGSDQLLSALKLEGVVSLVKGGVP